MVVSTWLGDHQGRPSAPLIRLIATIWRVTNVIDIEIEIDIDIDNENEYELK